MTECDNPECSNEPDNVYTDENDNRVYVCGACYWELVTGGKPTGKVFDLAEPWPEPIPDIDPWRPEPGEITIGGPHFYDGDEPPWGDARTRVGSGSESATIEYELGEPVHIKIE